MKKIITYALLCVMVLALFGCKDPLGEKPVVENKYAIGKTGPGGGTIYYYDSATGECKEVSENLGEHIWNDVFDTEGGEKIAKEYNANGFDDWIIPSLQELESIYNSKAVEVEKNILWASDKSDKVRYAWCFYFSNGERKEFEYENSDGEYESQGIRLIRSFNVSSL